MGKTSMPSFPSIFLFFGLCFFQNVESLSRSNPLMDTKVGLIRGLRSSNGQYSMFMGIPYGMVNASNPFGIAIKYPNFEKPFEAYDDSAACPQFYSFNNSVIGSLDCLRMNIYVPSTASSTNKLPVMIWLFGGAFLRGSASRMLYGPKYLVRHDVIMVAINYRMGPYGFMCLDIPDVPGNQGLKDQYMAFKWVYENIEAFGGDMNNIVLFGKSAGAHSLEFHLRSGYDRLFNKVIMESGSAVAATVLIDTEKQAPIKLAAYLGFITTDLYEALAFLASSTPDQVIDASNALHMPFKPCVEKVFDGVDHFLTTTWINTPAPKVANVSILLGFDENEAMMLYLNKDPEYFQRLNVFNDRLKISFNFSESHLAEMADLVRHYYIGDEALTEDVAWPLIDFESDFTYIHPLHRTMKLFIESGAENIYYYMFSHSGGRNYGKIDVNIIEDGAAHGDEMGYLFDMTILSEEITPADKLVLDRMTKMWTNFAKYSDPVPETTELLPVKWTPVTPEIFHCMKITSNLTLIRRPIHDRMAFWDLFYNMNKASLKTFDTY